jgi:hypothetical protein
MLSKPELAYFAIADISGYTSFLEIASARRPPFEPMMPSPKA